MQKGVFTTWIKELCALVFVQTIQAFILAIVLSILLVFLSPTNGKLTDQDSISALGLLCIILLTSLTKMEQITKKIFGLDSGLLQNKPPHGLMTSMMALKAAGRVLNNIPKMAGGISGIASGRLDKKKAMNANLTRLKRAGLDKNGKPLGDTESVEEGSTDSNNTLGDKEYYDKALAAKRKGDMPGYYKNMGIQAGIKKAMAANTPQPTSNKKNLNADKDVSKDYWKIMDKYDDEIAKAKEKRRKGVEELASGFAETVGATGGLMVGSAIGLTSGLATNDLDQIPKAMGLGVGAGDQLGESLTKITSQAISNSKSKRNTYSSLNKNLSQMEKNLKIEKNNKMKTAARFKDVQKAIKENNNIGDI